MPEGDSIHRLARQQQPLVGRRITFSQFRVPHLATVDVAGMTIARVHAWGKNLYWDLEGGQALTLHTHLRMDGAWTTRPVASGLRPTHETRLVVRVEGHPDVDAEVMLRADRLGMVDLWPTSEFASRTAHLGPDPLTAAWEGTGREQAVDNLLRSPGRPVHQGLLDQRVLAGVGNEYGNEVCFLMGVHPLLPVGDVDAPLLVDRVAALMRDNLPRVARTFTGIDRPGERTFVFGRFGRPCRSCGSPIRKDVSGAASSAADPEAGRERIIWWCPTCQPSP